MLNNRSSINKGNCHRLTLRICLVSSIRYLY